VSAEQTPRARGALLVDIGNTRVKWRLTGARHCDGFCPVESLVGHAPLAWRALRPPKWVLISAMSQQPHRELLKNWCEQEWHISPRFADSLTQVPGLENRYANPAQLGVDRWLALIAVRKLAEEPVLVVDCGTAITVDFVDRAGVFHGGMILPGRRLLESAFRTHIPHLEIATDRAPAFPADNTADAISLGIEMAIVASLDRFIENCRSLIGGETPLSRVTGGDGPWLAERWGAQTSVHENLVLDGLQILMEHNS
jgi:type III pantothenate kinase